jgi:hypothetical protein
MMDSRYGISAFYEGQRMRHESMTAYEEGGVAGLKDQALRELYNIGTKTSIIGTAVFFPSAFTQLTRFPTLLRGGMSVRGFFGTYGGNFSPFPSLGIVALGELYSRIKKSPRQDTLTSTPGVRVPKTRGGTKSSRAAGAAQTLKPFWSNGKPKCRKGYRYDFKRKMCVKKS